MPNGRKQGYVQKNFHRPRGDHRRICGGRDPRLKIRIPSVLHSYTNGLDEVAGSGATVDDVLRGIDEKFPGLRFRIVDETNNIRRHIMIFIDARRVTALSERIEPSAELSVIASISGG